MNRWPGVLALVLLASCGGGGGPAEAPSESPRPWFSEEAAERGLTFNHRSGHRERFLFPELMGGGVALFDMDGDGDLDAFAVQSGSLHENGGASHGLFENDGRGRFSDVSAGRGVGAAGYGMGVACADYDGDGDQDLYVTCVGPNQLLRNDGSGHFEDVAEVAGVADARWGTSAAFVDYDVDGDLDLFVANYVDWSIADELECFDPTGQPDYCNPKVYEAPARDTLYENLGGGAFADVTVPRGLGEARGNGLGVVAGDFNGDGRPDIFVANDQNPDRLWTLTESGVFVDRAEQACCARGPYGMSRAGMGVDAADVDDDDDLDLLVVQMARESDGFFRNNNGEFFVEETNRVGIGMGTIRMTRFGVGYQDFDSDGWLDVFVANGRVNLLMAPLLESDPYAEPNTLMRGTPSGRWETVKPVGGVEQALLATSRGAAFGDVDGDGGVDVLVGNRDGPLHMLMNRVVERGRWLSVRLVEERAGQLVDAHGANARVLVGERMLRRDVKSASSYCSASDPRLVFGLGEASGVVSIHVRWLDGTEEIFGPQSADQVITLKRGTGGK
ncbi:MAG: CRTAC1 family protein [Planctomycetota bacterium]|jgi:hypothetical protein|nr:CRTAC1 family protein [Planctomycetota bacterium]